MQNRLKPLLLPQDDAEAVKRYRKAAEQGAAIAWSNLGAMYDNGLGVSPDYVIAYMWFDLAAISGDEGAPNRIGSTMTEDNSKEAVAAFIAASLSNLIRMTEAHKDLRFLEYLMEMARVEAEHQTG